MSLTCDPHPLLSAKVPLALVVGPEDEEGKGPHSLSGKKFHVKNHPVEGWRYEETAIDNVQVEGSLLARVLIGDVADADRLTALLRFVPVVRGEPGWRCWSWVADALAEVARDDGGVFDRAVLDWDRIEGTARSYVGQKTDEGRYREGADMQAPRPTWDMLDNREAFH